MHQLRIVDGEALRSVLRSLSDLYGSHRNAAKQLGLVQSTFTRLLNGKVEKFMTFATYSRIKKMLEEHDPGPFGIPGEPESPYLGLLEGFEGCVLTMDGEFVLQNYQAWLEEEIKRLRPRADPVVKVLWRDRRFKGVFAYFFRRIGWGTTLPPPEETRIWLALYRVVEPIAAAEVTWGVERTWEEMEKDGEFRSYLAAALKRERILMRRERDLDRVRHSDKAALEEFKAWLAEDNTAGLPREDWTLAAGGGPVIVSSSDDVLSDQEESEGVKGDEEA